MRVSTTYIHMQGVKNILEQQSKVIRSQDQLSSGKKNLVPSDDPSAASRVLDLNEAISQIGQFEENGNYATQRLNLEETTIDSSINLLQRVRELAIQAANTGTNDLQTEQVIASEIKEKLQELMDYANTKDENGDYLFAGYQSRVQPFTTDGLGNYFYNGDEGQLALQIGANRQVMANDTGAEVFQLLRTGNGVFNVDANITNGGTGRISTGSVVTPSLYQAHDFSIVFAEVTPATVPPQYQYDVINETTGATVLAAQPYTDGGVIAFNGIEVEISGQPLDGDVFTVEASRHQDIFATLSNLIDSLESPASTEVRGVFGGDYINNGFGAGETVTFDLNFDGQTINFSVTPPTPTNAEVATQMMTTISTQPGIITNADGTYTLPGTTPGASVTFRRVGDNIEFITAGGTLDNANSVVINNITDVATNDAVLSINTSGNSVATQATLDAAVVGDSASYLAGAPPRSWLSQQIDNALNNIDRSMDKMINVQTSIGGRINSIESQAQDNEAKKVYLQGVRSNIEDLDMAEAISNLTFQTTALQIAQQTFVRIQNLNLFNFL